MTDSEPVQRHSLRKSGPGDRRGGAGDRRRSSSRPRRSEEKSRGSRGDEASSAGYHSEGTLTRGSANHNGRGVWGGGGVGGS